MKTKKGTVVSTKPDKTATVEVERLWRHPLYKKTVKRNKKYLAHDQIGTELGDQVVIKETRPKSKRKRWEVVKKIQSGRQQSKRK